MQIDIRALDILFRRIAPSQLWEQLRTNIPTSALSSARDLFQQYAVAELVEYSLDEHSLIFRRLQSEAAEFADNPVDCPYGMPFQGAAELSNAPEMTLPQVALYSVLHFAEQVLTDAEPEPMCRTEHTLPWREAYWLMGQDLFVCGFLAKRDLKMRRKRPHFAWPAVLRTNNRDLNQLLEKGIAENHQHMKGSSQTFALSWCSLMNYPERYEALEKYFSQLRQPFVQVTDSPSLNSTKDRVRCACLCRMHLFYWLKTMNTVDSTPTREDAPSTRFSSNPWWWLDPTVSEGGFAQELAHFRFTYGAKVPQKNRSMCCLDYALEPDVFNMAPDAGYRLLAGERSLLYQCFQAFLLNKMDTSIQMVFYLYLVLKELFRSELIQVNQQVGFRNFYIYQDRKDLLCDMPCYNEELIRMAIHAPLQEGNVKSLETRLSPLNTAPALINKLHEYDEMRQHAAKAVYSFQEPPENWWKSNRNPASDATDYFYVYHFIKELDNRLTKPSSMDNCCRHSSLRRTVRAQSIAIANALCSQTNFRRRVRGIDSSSFEIGCPPEVFATAFRFLRGFCPADLSAKYKDMDSSTYRLSTTYHAGEDFLDIVSGLRAIDDAVTLLELQRFDRIGHALALGVDPEAHYKMKGKKIFLTSQELLDNLVWILYQSNTWNISIDGLLRQQLTEKAQTLLLRIYGKAIEENQWNIDLHDYYCTMQLRGDDPQRYKKMRYNPEVAFGDYYGTYGISKHNSDLDTYRQSKKLAGMYYYYHFGNREKVIGNKVEVYPITQSFINLVRKLQDAQQFYLQEKGIVIECNPSSNVLIGTFHSYRNHPIFRFNNTGLVHDGKQHHACPQLKVCLNTDDLGVFDTSQEFEYALLYNALLEEVDEDGHPVYKESDILDYLERIRQYGFSVVFPPCNQKANQYKGTRKGF